MIRAYRSREWVYNVIFTILLDACKVNVCDLLSYNYLAFSE